MSFPNSLEEHSHTSRQSPNIFQNMTQGHAAGHVSSYSAYSSHTPDSPPRESYSQRSDVWNPVKQMNSSQKGFQKLGGQFAQILGLDSKRNVSRDDYDHDLDEIRMSIHNLETHTNRNEQNIDLCKQETGIFRGKLDRVYDRVIDLEDAHDQLNQQQKDLFSLVNQQTQILNTISTINDERWERLFNMQENTKNHFTELISNVEAKMNERPIEKEPQKVILHVKETQTKEHRPSTPEKHETLLTPKRSRKERIISDFPTNSKRNHVKSYSKNVIQIKKQEINNVAPSHKATEQVYYSWADDIDF